MRTPCPITRIVLAMFMALILAFAAPAGNAADVKVVGAGGGTPLHMELHKGAIVRLDRPAANVFVADPEIADVHVKSPQLLYVLSKKVGETTLFAMDRNERVITAQDILVEHNVEAMRRAALALYPNADVVFKTIGDQVLIEGRVPSATMAEDFRRLAVSYTGDKEKVINRVGVTAPSQVNLRVRVAEVTRDVDKLLGFQWSVVGSIGGVALNLATVDEFAASVTEHTLTLSGDRSGWSLSNLIDAMDKEGLVTVLAEPNLTAMSGETASFLAGGEFPILVPDSDGRVTIEFKKFGVSLAFTPTIVGDRINLHIRPEVSQISSTNSITLATYSVPSLTTRRAETKVELGSGQSFAIAGLLQNNITHDISKFPGLGDIPVLGGLFKSDRFQRDESELVIIVTPYIVRPVNDPKAFALPTDGYHPPHDIERLIIGGHYRRNPEQGAATTVTTDGRRLKGPVGFQLD